MLGSPSMHHFPRPAFVLDRICNKNQFWEVGTQRNKGYHPIRYQMNAVATHLFNDALFLTIVE